MKGRVRRQERSDEFLQFRLIWGVPTGQSAAWCARVETRPCDRATTGVVWEAVEAEGVVCSRRLDSARPRKGISWPSTAWTVTVGQLSVRSVCVYFMWLSASQVQARAVFPMHPPHTPIVSVHGSDRYMVYLECTQLFGRRQSAVKAAFCDAFVCHDAGWESTQGSYHTD